MHRQADNLYTIIFVPHSERPVASFRVRAVHVQIIVLVLVLFLLGLLMVIAQASQMVAHMRELEELRLVNQEQRRLIRALADEAALLQEQMRSLQELERQLLEMTRISPQELRRAGPQSFLPADGAAPATARAASAVRPGAVPPAAGNVVSLAPIAQARDTESELAELREQIALRQGTLEVLRQSIATTQAEQAARPSGWPVQGHITSRFGYRSSPVGAGVEFHAGVDIATRRGSPIVATADGQVVFSGWMGRYGNTVIIDHGHGYRTLYGHNDKNAVAVGERVTRGQIIAYVGSTGRSTGPHVHYEVHQAGKQINPLPYLKGQ